MEKKQGQKLSKEIIYLVQTDTTVGFLGKNREKLNRVKGRPPNQPILREVESLEWLTRMARTPFPFRREIRRRRQVSYILGRGGEGFRVVDWGPHGQFLKGKGWFYSTSANFTGKKFDRKWAEEKAEIVVEDWRGLTENNPSPIYQLGRKRKKRFR